MEVTPQEIIEALTAELAQVRFELTCQRVIAQKLAARVEELAPGSFEPRSEVPPAGDEGA